MKNCFIIVNYNDFKSTKHLVSNIVNYNNVDHILIVDNNSIPEDKEELKTLISEKVEVLFLDDNLGYSHALNEGSHYLLSKYDNVNFIMSNSDVILMSDQDITRLSEVLNSGDVGLVGPRILERGEILKGYKDISVNFEILSSIPLLNLFVGNKKKEYSSSHYNSDVTEVEVINSCFFMISSETLRKIGFMDESVFLYYEDYILCNKVRSLGLKICLCNDVKIKHLFSVSVDKNYNKREKNKLINSSRYYYHTTFHKTNFIQRKLLKILLKRDV